MPRAGSEDSDLVGRVRRGDDLAFEELFQRYHRRITAYVLGMVHDHARAEDVAQDVFVSALRRMRDTDRPIAFKPWIYEIAKNACIDQFRRSRRAEEVSYDAEEGMGAADYGRMVSADAVPETRLESKQNLDHLRGAFGGLSETHHEILVMRELEGLSYREIGDRLGMSRPSVESTLFRARRRLTEEYEELISGARCQRIQAIIGEGASLGARDQRRLARHVSHCQPCRRQARLAGLEVPVTADRPVRQRIAAILPLPLFLRRRWLDLPARQATDVSSSHLTGFAQWSAQLGSNVDPSWVKAAATAATVAVAGVGAGVASRTTTPVTPVGDLGQIVNRIDSGSGGHAAGLSARSGPRRVVSRGGTLAPAAAGSTAGASAQPASDSDGTPGGSATSATASGGGGSATAPAHSSPAVPGTGAPSLASGVAPPASGSPPSVGAAGTPAPHVAAPATPSAPQAPAVTVAAPDSSSAVGTVTNGLGGAGSSGVTGAIHGLGGG